jgi:putative tricarboxylic transport membrane protein
MSASFRKAATGMGTRVPRVPVPDVVVAAAVTLLGLFVVVDAHRITVPLSSNVVGPRVFPYAVGGALVVAGVAVVVEALRGSRGVPEGGEDVDADAPTDWATLAKLVIGFALHVLLVDTIGWALAGALLFTAAAWALGGSPLKAAGIGLVLGFVVQAAFVTGLGVSLPSGPFDGVELLSG